MFIVLNYISVQYLYTLILTEINDCMYGIVLIEPAMHDGNTNNVLKNAWRN